jgi:hypothetical protein
LLLLKKWLQHHQKFTASATRLMFTDAKHFLYDALFVADFFELPALMFVKSLP